MLLMTSQLNNLQNHLLNKRQIVLKEMTSSLTLPMY